MPPEVRGRIGKKIVDAITLIVASPSPSLANRENIFNSAHEMARFGVLIMRPDSEADVFLLETPGITGELRGRLAEVVTLDPDLKEAIWKAGAELESEDTVYDACYAGYAISWLCLTVYDGLRREVFEDFNDNVEYDWLRPLIQALYAWHEHRYRERLGLPSALGCGTIEALEVSTLGNIVMEGQRNPLWEWEQRFGRKWGTPRPLDSLSRLVQPS